jgi:hypothetical protein
MVNIFKQTLEEEIMDPLDIFGPLVFFAKRSNLLALVAIEMLNLAQFNHFLFLGLEFLIGMWEHCQFNGFLTHFHNILVLGYSKTVHQFLLVGLRFGGLGT